MSYIKATVTRPNGNPGKGITPKDMMIIYDVDDIRSFPRRDDAGVVHVGDIVLKPGRYATALYLTTGTVELASNSDGDTDAEGFTPSVKGKHPGNKREIREFKANWLGKKCIIVMDYCSGEDSDIIGSPCNPCKMAVAYTGNNESNASEFTFTQISKGDDIGLYAGTHTLEEPVGVVTSGSDRIGYIADGQYQLSNGAAEIKGVDGGQHGALITLIGTDSGPAPTISADTAGTVFILKNGKTFTASAGSQITFRAFAKTQSSLVWIEESRYEL